MHFQNYLLKPIQWFEFLYKSVRTEIYPMFGTIVAYSGYRKNKGTY
jgi:hypothetical protein